MTSASTAAAAVTRFLIDLLLGLACGTNSRAWRYSATPHQPVSRGGEMKRTAIAAAAMVLAACGALQQDGGKHDMSFFVTSTGKGNGANLGGIEGADAHCNALAK